MPHGGRVSLARQCAASRQTQVAAELRRHTLIHPNPASLFAVDCRRLRRTSPNKRSCRPHDQVRTEGSQLNWIAQSPSICFEGTLWSITNSSPNLVDGEKP